MLEQTGLSSINIMTLPMTFECDSPLDYCGVFMDYGWRTRIAALSAEESERFYQTVAEATRPYAANGLVRLGASSLCACARK